ncbi:hypothetical protein D3C78_1103120 [compost metagenome]
MIQSNLRHFQLIDAYSASYFICNKQQRPSCRTDRSRNKFESFRAGICIQIHLARVIQKNARICVVYEKWSLRIRNVIRHHTADTLQTDKCEHAIADLSDFNILRLRPFLRASVILLNLAVADIEVIRQTLARYRFKVTSAVINKLHRVRVPNGEGATTV